MTTERVTSFQTILQIVKSFMNRRGEKSLTYIERYCQIAIEGFSELNISTMNVIDVAYLTVNTDTNTVRLPVDFIEYTKIGFRHCGKVFTLGLNENILLPPPDTICEEGIDTLSATTEADGGYYFFPHYLGTTYYDALYGIGGGFNPAYYRVDYKNGIIVLNGRVPNDEIILEYKSSGVKVGGAVVPRLAVPAVRAYLDWVITENDFRKGDGEKLRKQRLYEIEARKLASIEMAFTLSEMMDALYEGYSQAPKR